MVLHVNCQMTAGHQLEIPGSIWKKKDFNYIENLFRMLSIYKWNENCSPWLEIADIESYNIIIYLSGDLESQ